MNYERSGSIGFVFSGFLVVWGKLPETIAFPTGAVIGIPTGLLLRLLWKQADAEE